MDPSDPAASLERPPRTSALPQYYRKLCRPKQIRVVSISPGQWKDPIRCRLLHYELSELHEADSCYKALSYVWGSSVVKDIIYVEDISRVGNIVRIEDHPVEITFNLFCALRYLRHTDHDVVLWVDALCINQEDDKERSHQVSLMRQIYEQAKEVIVFMGDGRSHRIQRLDLTEPPMCPKRQIYGGYKDDAFLDEFLETCRSAKLKVLRSPASAGLCAMGLVRLFSAEDKNEYCREIMSLREPVRRHLFECLKCFLVCPWWKRIWVVQEVAVSKKVIVQYGTVSACWEIFVGATNFISSHHKRTTALAELEPENLKVLDLLNSQLSNLERTRQRWHEEGGTHLVHLLQEFSNREATDDRDKVYGLLSLAKWEHGISPDYTLDVFQVYRNTFLGRNAAGPDLACWAGDQKRKNRRDLPSWIPDWSHGLDIADRRRMTLLDTYKAKTGWTLKVIHEEQEYWCTVGNEMKRLTDDLKKQCKQLPGSLLPVLDWYIRCLEARVRALDTGFCENCLRAILHALDHWQLQGVAPRSGRGSRLQLGIQLQEASRDTCTYWCLPSQKRLTDAKFVRDPSMFTMSWLMNELFRSSAPRNRKYLDIKDLVQGCYYWTESLLSLNFLDSDWASVSDMGPTLARQKQGIGHALGSLIDQCKVLATFCNDPNDRKNPWELFRCSYTFRKNVSWMSNVQRVVPRPDGEDMSWCAAPPMDLSLDDPERVLNLQTVLRDRVKQVGPRMLGWSDKQAATQTLMHWMYLVGSRPEGSNLGRPDEVWLDSQQLLGFARTITGGISLPDFEPLIDWLERLFLRTQVAHVSSRQQGRQDINILRIPPDFAASFSSGVSESLAPPSSFFEAIELATDGRAFFVSEEGTTGLGPVSMQPGDTVHMFPSGLSHFVLRDVASLHPTSKLEQLWCEEKHLPAFELIGDCYLNTDDGLSLRDTDKNRTVLEGSLPYELLGAAYLEDSPWSVQTVTLF